MAKPQKKAAKKVAPKKAAPARKAAAKKPAPKKAAPAKKAAPKKAAPKKVAPKKAAPVKKAAPAKKAAPPKKAAPAPAKKAAPAPVKKAAPPAKKMAPVKKPAPPAKATKAPVQPRPAEPEKPKVKKPLKELKVDDLKEPPADAAVEPGAARSAPAVPPPPGGSTVPVAAAPAAATAPAKVPGKRGRKRKDPLEDLLKPQKEKRRAGRPRKRAGLVELIPKRARIKRRMRRREEDGDLPVTPRPPAPRDTMSLEEIRADVMVRYLRGETPVCPVGCGGTAQVVRISTNPNGSGEVWFECLSCAQREKFETPAPTPQERDAVYAALDAGNEPLCPRHSGRWVQMRRRGRDYVCPEDGILIPGR